MWVCICMCWHIYHASRPMSSDSRASRPKGKQRANVKRVTAKIKSSHGPILSMPNAEQVQHSIGAALVAVNALDMLLKLTAPSSKQWVRLDSRPRNRQGNLLHIGLSTEASICR